MRVHGPVIDDSNILETELSGAHGVTCNSPGNVKKAWIRGDWSEDLK